MRLVSLAWRNIRRNKRRTSLTLSAMVVGVLALMLAWSIFDGNGLKMIRDQSGYFTGHLQIHQRGYDRDPSLDLTFRADEVAALQLEQIPGVVAAAPRLAGRALISSETNSRGVMLVGIDPGQERAVTRLHEQLSSGQPLEAGRQGDILIGHALAKSLKIGVGDSLAVITQGLRGAFGSARYRVCGIFDTQNEAADSMQAFITLSDAHALYAAQGELTTVAVRLDDHERSMSLAPLLASQLGERFEVLNWKQLLPSVDQFISFHDGMVNLFMIVLMAIVAVGIANTILMSTIDRVREFGVMMAIGTSPFQVFRMVVYEGLLIAILGLCIGVVLASVPIAYFSAVGLKMGASSQAMQTLQSQGVKTTEIVYPHLAWYRVWVLAAVVLVVTTLATAYPAWQTARRQPIQAMRGLVGGMKQSSSRLAGWSATRFLPLALALRNLGRHPLRACLTISAVVIGTAALVFLSSLGKGYFSQIIENSTGLVAGQAQIQRTDFRTDRDLKLALSDGNRLLQDLRGIPEIAAASPRLETTASVGTSLQAEPMVLVGVDPAQEPRVTFLSRAIRQGAYLTPGRDRDILIGKKMADLLGVRLGEKVVVTAANVSGELVFEAFRVAGIFDTGSHGSDRSLGYISLKSAQKMLGMGDKVTSIALRLRDREQQSVALKKAALVLGHADERVLSWQELLPDMEKISSVARAVLLAILSIVLLMVSVLVMNTILMSVLERTREFGVMLAIGSLPRKIVQLVSIEAAVIGLMGTALGLLSGGLLVWLHMSKGINLSAHGATAVEGVTNVLYPRFDAEFLLLSGLLLPVLVLVASLYPAFRASRLEPVKAIRHV